MKSPAFQFYVKDWLGDDKVMLMSSGARALHLHFMCLAWQQEPACTLPDDDSMLQAWAANMPDWIDLRERWPRLKAEVFRAWTFIADKGRWLQAGLLKQFKKQQDTSATKRRAANERWKREKADQPPKAARVRGKQSVSEPDARALHVECPSTPTPTSSSLLGGGGESTRGANASSSQRKLLKKFPQCVSSIRRFDAAAGYDWIEALLQKCIQVRPGVTDEELVQGLWATRCRDQRGAGWWGEKLPDHLEGLAVAPSECEECHGSGEISAFPISEFATSAEMIRAYERAVEKGLPLTRPCSVCQPASRMPPGQEQGHLAFSASQGSG